MGRLCYVPPPLRSLQDAVLQIATSLRRLVEAVAGYVGISPLGVVLSPTIGFEPDVLYVAPGREHMLSERGVEGAPDLVIEVLSPPISAFDEGPKLRAYLEHGVREVWLVDLEARRVTVHAATGSKSVACGTEVPSEVVAVGPAGLA